MKTTHSRVLRSIGFLLLGLGQLELTGPSVSAERIGLSGPMVQTSSSAPEFGAAGVVDGNRFAADAGFAWKGQSAATSWWWQIRFDTPRAVGAILQVVGDHSFVLQNAPKRCVWQWSSDGSEWHDFKETQKTDERRLFRIHRLRKATLVRYVRLHIFEAWGDYPTLREVEFYSSPADAIPFPSWIVSVNTTDNAELPGHGQEFIPLVRECQGWEETPAQQVWIGAFDELFVAAEPRPICAFLSGNFKDWCEISREPWRGTQEILRRRNLPMWASCGGAQGLALLAETGVDRPWDCPHCRDPRHPKSPIYTHIGHTGQRPCGDYSACVFERGPHQVQRAARDPVFDGLPEDFSVMESHCGQIEWPPRGWVLIARAGAGTQTEIQCLRMQDRYVYAAQFHIEMAGTPGNSRRIMANFLSLAKGWGGYNPKGKAVERPERSNDADH